MERDISGISRRDFVKAGLGTTAGLTAGIKPEALISSPRRAVEDALYPTMPLLFPDNWEQMENLGWRIELAKKDPKNPLLTPKYPWDAAACFAHGTVLKDPIDGLWKIWHVSTGAAGARSRVLTYAESRDGVEWNRPMLDLCKYENYERTNILLGLDSGGVSTYMSVFVDPSAPNDRRYEMFTFRTPEWGSPDGKVRGFPLPPGKDKHQSGLFRYRSSDGIRWNPYEGPINLATSDSCYVYRQEDGSYLSYHKMEIDSLPGGLVPYDVGRGGCRIIFRRTSTDGNQWSDPPLLVLAPDWRDPQDTQFMELTPLPHGGAFVALVTVYHPISSTIDLQFAASRDGVKWWRPDRRACVRLEALGDDEGGMLWPTRQMVEHEGRIYVYYNGGRGLHQDIYSTQYPVHDRLLKLHGQNYTLAVVGGGDSGGICRASWEKGRYWALVPASGGSLKGSGLTKSAEVGGKQLYVNAVTMNEGRLTAELLDEGGKVVPGFSGDDCNPLRGDQKRFAMSWKGGKVPGSKRVAVRFHLYDARLYGFDWS